MSELTDSQFLRELAHIAEIGDPIEQRDIDRLREIALTLDVDPAEPVDGGE